MIPNQNCLDVRSTAYSSITYDLGYLGSLKKGINPTFDLNSGLQIRRGKRDNRGMIFNITSLKRML